MPTLHIVSALLSLTAFAGSLGERGASRWARCVAAVMAVAMVGGLTPGLAAIPDAVWCCALIALAIGSAFVQRRAGRQGIEALRMPLSSVAMAALIVTVGASHSTGNAAATAATTAASAIGSTAAHDHHGGGSVVVIILLAAGAQLALCIGELRQRSAPGGAAPRRGRALVVRTSSMGGAALAMALAVLLAG